MIERDELVNIAREARSWKYLDQRGDAEDGTFCFDEDSIKVFANDILNRAALLCENMQQEHTPKDCAYLIRALANEQTKEMK